jgi:hypothetical protein
MAQKGATIASPRGNRRIDIGVGTKFARCATICSNTIEYESMLPSRQGSITRTNIFGNI